jgi:two-component system response regulator DctR
MNSPTAQIVDDDSAVRDALQWLLKSRRVASQAWKSAEAFLDYASPGLCGCLLLDVRMPGMSGIELFDRLRVLNCRLPVIFLTGHGDVPMAVQALKDGAFDFIEKPYDDNALVDKVLAAIDHDKKRCAKDGALVLLQQRLAQLTPREHEVMQLILAGRLNKVIADELNIAMRTVEVHRSHIFAKMQVRSAVELSQVLGLLGETNNH